MVSSPLMCNGWCSNLGLSVLKSDRMKFYESCSFFGISCLLTSSFAFGERTPGKKQPQGVATPWESPRKGHFCFKAKMLRTHENFHNAPPTGRRGLLGCSLPANYHHGRVCVVEIF